MSRTMDVQHNISCPVCNKGILYIGNIDRTKEIVSERTQADSVIALPGKGFYATDGRYLGVEVIVTCPSCDSAIKTTNAAKVIE
ncbi:hypothetical protein [Bacillus infantis]|uniref:hypothetical protein n=1 Tax=Bacillus infantis TaxID=324767 RepID=UPI003CE6F3C5